MEKSFRGHSVAEQKSLWGKRIKAHRMEEVSMVSYLMNIYGIPGSFG
jgi:hypothetical protein